MPFGTEVGLDPGHIVLDWDPAPPSALSPKRGQQPQFSAHVCCGQMAGWIKMPLGTEVGLSPGNIVLDGDPALPRKGAQQPPPHFSAHVYCVKTVARLRYSFLVTLHLRLGRFGFSNSVRFGLVFNLKYSISVFFRFQYLHTTTMQEYSIV